MLFGREPSLSQLGDRVPIGAHVTASLNFAQQIAQPMLRVGFRSPHRLSALPALAVVAARQFDAQVPSAAGSPALDVAFHRVRRGYSTGGPGMLRAPSA